MFIDACVKYLQGSIEMVSGTGLSHFVRIPSSECASLDVFIRKSCEERCKHGLDRDLLTPLPIMSSRPAGQNCFTVTGDENQGEEEEEECTIAAE